MVNDISLGMILFYHDSIIQLSPLVGLSRL